MLLSWILWNHGGSRDSFVEHEDDTLDSLGRQRSFFNLTVLHLVDRHFSSILSLFQFIHFSTILFYFLPLPIQKETWSLHII